jgi:hypothetical protein
MASEEKVKRYLAQWFHLGKKVIFNKNQEAICPDPVIIKDHYSPVFEHYWQKILSVNGEDYYLEGTEETIAQLLSFEWEIHPCSRCQMPVPLKERGLPPSSCPCFDLSNWPNLDIPIPHNPINNQTHLQKLKLRLNQDKS